MESVVIRLAVIGLIVGVLGYFTLKVLFKNSIFFKIGALWMINVFYTVVNSRIHYDNPEKFPIWMALLVGILVTLILQYLVFLQVKRPLQRITNQLHEIANGKISSVHNEFTGLLKGEILTIHKSVETLQQNISGVIKDVEKSAESVNHMGESINNTAKDLANGANRQAANVEEVSSSMEEMAANIDANAQNAGTTKSNSTETNKAVIDSFEKTKLALSTMQQIGEKIQVIDEIAVQTNLLALNAAVEASRAGDEGKGFGVVAAEVRKLAERSKKAAQEIDEFSKSGNEVAEIALAKLQETLPLIKKNEELVSEISSSSQEQSMGASQINSAIQNISSTTQSNAAISEKMSLTSNQLSKQAIELTQKLQFFRLV